MTDSHQELIAHAREILGEAITAVSESVGEVTLEVQRERIVEACRALRDDPALAFAQLIDLCGVDYLEYGQESPQGPRQGPRFAVVYHLLSITHNRRLRCERRALL